VKFNYEKQISVWLERRNIMNKFKEKILIKKEKLILCYLYIITSIFGIFFYTFIIVNGIGFLVSIIILIIGVSSTILLLKGKLSSIKKSDDKNMYLIVSILYYILGVLQFLYFIVNPYENALYFFISLVWSVGAAYNTAIYVKLREI